MSETMQSKPVKTTHWTRHAVLYVGLPLAAFLFGFVPTWWKSLEYFSRLLEVERQLSLTRLKNALASAVIDARRGDYEAARQAASDFFTSLQAETDGEAASTLSPAQRAGLTQRDEIITLLARGDPAAANQLSDLYVAYYKDISH